MTRSSWIVAGPLLVGLALLFAPILLSGDPVYGFDIVHEKLYWHQWVWATWAKGEIPTWNPHLACGVPFLANPNASPLYPPAALHLLLPTDAALTLLVALHLAWFGLGAAYLVRGFGGGPVAAAVAAVTLALGGFAVGRVLLGSVPHLFAVSWAPWIWALTDRGLRTRSARAYLGAMAACGLSLLAGHPQMTALGLLGAGVQLVVRLFERDAGTRPLRALLAFAAVPIGACVLAAAQVLPLLDLLHERGGVETFDTESVERLGTIPLWQLPQLLVHPFFGDGIESLYVGSFLHPLLLAHVGALAWFLAFSLGRRAISPSARGPLLVAGVGLFLALDVAAATWVRGLPPFDLFRLHGRWLGLTAMGVAVLAGLGLEALLERDARPRAWWCGGLPLVAALGLLALLAPGPDGWFWSHVYDDWAERTMRLYMDSDFEAPGARAAAHATALRATLLFAACSVVGPGLILASRRRLAPRRVALLALTMITAELVVAARPYVRAYDRALVWTAAPPSLLARDPERPERFASAISAEQTPLPGNLNRAYLWLNTVSQASYHRASAWGLESAQASLWPISPALHAIATDGAPFEQRFYVHRRVLDLVGARHVLVATDADLAWVAARTNLPDASVFAGLEPVETVGAVSVYSNPDAFPRVLYVREATVAESSEAAVALVTDPGFPLRRRAVVESQVQIPRDTSAVDDDFHFRRPTERSIEIDVTLSTGALAVIVEAHDPGWRAWLDGQPAEILRADAAFMGVTVPAGAHLIRMRHEPWYAAAGLTTSALAWLALAAAAIVLGRSSRRARANREA